MPGENHTKIRHGNPTAPPDGYPTLPPGVKKSSLFGPLCSLVSSPIIPPIPAKNYQKIFCRTHLHRGKPTVKCFPCGCTCRFCGSFVLCLDILFISVVTGVCDGTET